MLYYVQSGNVDTSLKANNHKHAAMMAASNFRCDMGTLTVVSEKKIEDDDSDLSDHVYFHTESIIEECFRMRLV